jgi:hypothetical protein
VIALDERSSVRVALACALAIALPTLAIGFHLDDWWHLAMLDDAPPGGTIGTLFAFARGEELTVPAGAQGPWWAAPDLRISFLRPLPAALAEIDHALFGANPIGWHVHAIGWWLATVAAAGALFRRVLPGSIGGLAVVLFAIDDVSWLPVAWLANRNALVCATFGLLAVGAHVSWRTSGRRSAAVASVGLWTLALLGGEGAIAAVAYAVAWEVACGGGTLGRRAAALAPVGALVLAWAVAWRLLGHGAWASGSYVDPLAEPAAWLAGAPGRALALIGCLLVMVPADLWYLVDGARPWQVGAGVLGLGLFAGLAREAVRAGEWSPAEIAGIRFFALGALLAIVPALSTFPANRLLLLPSLGGAALAAGVLRSWWRTRWTERDPGHVLRLAGGLVFWTAVVFAPLPWLASSWVLARFSARVVELSKGAELDGCEHAVLMVAPDPAIAYYLPAVRKVHGLDVPRGWRFLSIAPVPHRIERIDDRTLRLTATDGRLLATEFEQMVRAPRYALGEGDVVRADGMAAAIVDADRDGVASVEFAFDGSLHDPSLCLLGYDRGTIRRVHVGRDPVNVPVVRWSD